MDSINKLKQAQKQNHGIKAGDIKKFERENRLVEPVFENQKITETTRSVTRIKYDDNKNIFTSESVSLMKLDEEVREEYAFAQNQKDIKKAKVKGKTKDKRRSEYQKKTSQSAFVKKIWSNLADQKNKEYTDLLDIGVNVGLSQERVETFGMDCVRFLNSVEGDSAYRNKEFLENMHFEKDNDELTAEEKALKRTELERVMHNILKLDLSMFEYNSNDELVKNDLEAKMRILNSTENLDQLLSEYMDVYDKNISIFNNDDVREFNVRILALNNIREEYRLKLNIINSPQYALLGKTQLDSLSDEDLEQRINSIDFKSGDQKERTRGYFYDNLLKLRNLHKKKYGFKEGAGTKDMLAGIRKQNKLKDPKYEKSKAADNDANLYLNESQTVLKTFGALMGDAKNQIISANSFRSGSLMDIKSERDKKIRSIYNTLNYKDEVKDKEEIEKEIESIHKNYAKNKAYAARLGEIRDKNRAYVNDFADKIVKKSLKDRNIKINDVNLAEEGRDVKVIAAVYSRLTFRDNKFDNNIELEKCADFFNELTGVKKTENEAGEAVKERQNAAFKKVFNMVANYDLGLFSKYSSIDQLMKQGNMQDLIDLRHMAEMAGVTKKILENEGKDAYEGLDEKTRQQFDLKLEFFESMFVYMGKSALVNANPVSLFMSDEMKQSLMSGAAPLKINKKYGDKILERNQGLNDRLLDSDSKQDAQILRTFITLNGGLTTKDGFDEKLSITENLEQFKLNKKYEPILKRLKEFDDDRSGKYDDRRFDLYLDFVSDTNIDDLLMVPEKFTSQYTKTFNSLCLVFTDATFLNRLKGNKNYSSIYHKIQVFNELATKYSNMGRREECNNQGDFIANENRIKAAEEEYHKQYSSYVTTKKYEDLRDRLENAGPEDTIKVFNSLKTLELAKLEGDDHAKITLPLVKLMNQKLENEEVKNLLEKQGNAYSISLIKKALKAIENGEPLENIENIWKNKLNVFDERARVRRDYFNDLKKEAGYRNDECRSHKSFFDKVKLYNTGNVDEKYYVFTNQLKDLKGKLENAANEAAGKELLKQIEETEEHIRACKYIKRFFVHYYVYDSKSKEYNKTTELIQESMFRAPTSMHFNPVIMKMDKARFNNMVDKLTSGTFEYDKEKSEVEALKFQRDNEEGLKIYRDVIAENYERLFMKYGFSLIEDNTFMLENADEILRELPNSQVDSVLSKNPAFHDPKSKKGQRLVSLVNLFHGVVSSYGTIRNFYKMSINGKEVVDDMMYSYKDQVANLKTFVGKDIKFLKENPTPMFLNGYGD
ncbi:MAG: hypothetical protein K6F99_04800 [Lachnospiraceae bacterium]|nr:hypothetical protein [Lachnospiraceae bacterium]